jgi:hypothetical protein
MSYQGLLLDSLGVPLEGDYNMSFSIHSDSTGGTQLWTEDHNNSTRKVTVNDGLFEVILGEFVPIDSTVFDGSPRWLQTEVAGEVLFPRKPITSGAYAFMSGDDRIEGSGTAGYLPKFEAPDRIGDSQVFDDGSNVGIGNQSPAYKLDVNGDVNADAYHGDGSNLTGIFRVYNSGWFYVERNQGYDLTHDLSSTDLLFSVFFNTSAADVGAQLVMPMENRMNTDGNQLAFYGLRISNSSVVRLYTGNEQVAITMNFSNGEPINHQEGYYKVIAVAVD